MLSKKKGQKSKHLKAKCFKMTYRRLEKAEALLLRSYSCLDGITHTPTMM